MQMGYVTDDKGESQPMSGIRLASAIREIQRGAPTLMLYALEHPDDIKSAPAQKLGDQSCPAIALKVGQHNFTFCSTASPSCRSRSAPATMTTSRATPPTNMC